MLFASGLICILALISGSVSRVKCDEVFEEKVPRVSGQLSVRGQFPYQAFIRTLDGAVHGGALIDRDWVITSPAAIEGYAHWEVILGAQNINQAEDYRQLIECTLAFVSGTPQVGYEGIAIIKLGAPAEIDLTDYIKIVDLPSRSDVNTSFTGTPVVVTGWGSGTIDISADLQYSDATIIGDDVCGTTYTTVDLAQSFCAQANGTQAVVCGADVGGPLVDPATNKLLGVATVTTLGGCGNAVPDLYNRITYFLDFIKMITGLPIQD